MLSYQHIYHAGSVADIHKHSILAMLLGELIKDPKQINYFETHAGRGLYDLNTKEADKTGEASKGVKLMFERGFFIPSDSLLRVIKVTQQKFGPSFYPGSPMIASEILRKKDNIELMELHPGEINHLHTNMAGANIHFEDGYDGVWRLTPPSSKKGLILIDPSFEVKNEYQLVSDFIEQMHERWPEAVIMLWYPILAQGHYKAMLRELFETGQKNHFSDEIIYPDNGKFRMHGSGVFIINLPQDLNGAIQDMHKRIELFLYK